MGTERYLMFNSRPEANRVRKYLAGSCGLDGIWWEWDGPYSKRMSVGYSSTDINDALAQTFCQGLARRFQVSKIGTSHGWYPEREWQGTDRPTSHYGVFHSWVDWLANYDMTLYVHGDVDMTPYIERVQEFLHTLDQT